MSDIATFAGIKTNVLYSIQFRSISEKESLFLLAVNLDSISSIDAYYRFTFLAKDRIFDRVMSKAVFDTYFIEVE